MEVTFNANQTPVNEAVPTQAAVAPETPPTASTQENLLPAQTGARVPAGPAGLVLGDKLPEFKDIILPRVNIVQNIGRLKESYEPGVLLFDRGVVLFSPGKVDPKTQASIRAPTPPAVMTIFGFRPTRYCEKVQGGVGGLIVDTEDAVRANGGTLDYGEWELKKGAGMRRFEPMADALVAVERPESITGGNDTLFTYEVDGKNYALGLWAMRGTSYTAAAKRVFFTARAVGCLRKGGYPSYQFAVTTKLESYPGGNTAWVPVCVPIRPNTEPFMAFVRDVLGG